MTSITGQSPADFWLFGYGSLIWKPPPHFGTEFTLQGLQASRGLTVAADQRVSGYIKGYVRRFWQASEDHRGTPKAPGRVVTLIERSFWATLDDEQGRTENDRVWGAAYHIIPSKVAEVQEYLDIREINGYSIQYTPFHPADNDRAVIRCLVYIVASTINDSIGPSGENREYLFNLETALESLGEDSHDEHISDLARRVRAMTPPLR